MSTHPLYERDEADARARIAANRVASGLLAVVKGECDDIDLTDGVEATVHGILRDALSAMELSARSLRALPKSVVLGDDDDSCRAVAAAEAKAREESGLWTDIISTGQESGLLSLVLEEAETVTRADLAEDLAATVQRWGGSNGVTS